MEVNQASLQRKCPHVVDTRMALATAYDVSELDCMIRLRARVFVCASLEFLTIVLGKRRKQAHLAICGSKPHSSRKRRTQHSPILSRAWPQQQQAPCCESHALCCRVVRAVTLKHPLILPTLACSPHWCGRMAAVQSNYQSFLTAHSNRLQAAA